MDTETLVRVLESAGYEPRSYSGRGMYGDSCVGIEVPADCSLFRVAAELAQAALSDLENEEAAWEFMEELQSLEVRKDSMGLDQIVYFPRAAWTNETPA